MNTISPCELQEKYQRGETIVLIDVRTPVEFREVHSTLARNIPLDRLDPKEFMQSQTNFNQPIYLICNSGTRGRMACEKFTAAGFANAVNVEGGTKAWVADNLPVVRGKKTISLERQVRIVAGSLVLLGTALGYFVHPAFLGLSAFIGAGLVFAGITDFCGMALILGRMPWNQVKEPAPKPSPATV